MGISDHYKGGITERLTAVVITSDPTTQRVEVVSKDAAVIQIGISPLPALFRWPVEGEYWTIVRENGNWTLESIVESPNATKRTENMAVGESLIQSEVVWTPSGERFITTKDHAVPLVKLLPWNPPSLATGTQTTISTDVPGANMGDVAAVGFSRDLQGMQLTAYVSATNTVTVVLRNGTAGTLDLSSGQLKIKVWY